MRILLVFATYKEFSMLNNALTSYEAGNNNFRFNDHQLHFCITGIGIVNTVFQLTHKLCSNNYDLIINMGICGSFKPEFKMGEVLCVRQDRFADWGIIEDGQFKDVFDMELEDKNKSPFKDGWLHHQVPEGLENLLPEYLVKAFTVNTIRAKGFNLLDSRYEADVESMEGAAFFFVCNQLNIPCIQLRSVSNIVGERDKLKWDLVAALKNLTDYFMNGFLKKL